MPNLQALSNQGQTINWVSTQKVDGKPTPIEKESVVSFLDAETKLEEIERESAADLKGKGKKAEEILKEFFEYFGSGSGFKQSEHIMDIS
jgi:hypothetical protein